MTRRKASSCREFSGFRLLIAARILYTRGKDYIPEKLKFLSDLSPSVASTLQSLFVIVERSCFSSYDSSRHGVVEGKAWV